MVKINRKNTAIYPEQPHLILCEGVDAYYFLMWLLDDVKQQQPKFAEFWLYNFKGITQLTEYLSNLSKMDGFSENVKSICVIRDAETAASGACQSIKTSLQACGFAVPDKPCIKADGSGDYPQIATGFALFPTISESPENGTLEDLCLRILAKADAEELLGQADKVLEPHKEQLARLHKNRLHTYFSLTDDFVSLKIGEASKCKAFDYGAPDILSLKSFLLQMTGA
jgi:hypothetical protein